MKEIINSRIVLCYKGIDDSVQCGRGDTQMVIVDMLHQGWSPTFTGI